MLREPLVQPYCARKRNLAVMNYSYRSIPRASDIEAMILAEDGKFSFFCLLSIRLYLTYIVHSSFEIAVSEVWNKYIELGLFKCADCWDINSWI